MGTGHRRGARSGFTLLELLLALSILSVILAVISGALRLAVGAWEKGERAAAAQQRSRTVLDQIDRQLSSAVVLAGGRGEDPLVAFSGSPRRVEFTSGLALASRVHAAPVHAAYAVEAGPDGRVRLLLYEEGIDADDYASGGPLTHRSEPFVLAEGLEDVRFEYLDDAGDEPDLPWAAAWQPSSPADLPRAVRVTWTDAPGGAPVRVIARLPWWSRGRSDS